MPKPYVDSGLLLRTMAAHEKVVRDLGSYELVSRTGAVDPTGILHCLDLVKGLVMIESSAEIHPQPLRTALLQMLTQTPTLNNTKYNGKVWANLKAERIGRLMIRVRKLARTESLSSCAARLTSREFLKLEEVLKLVELRDKEKDLEKESLEKEALEEENLEKAVSEEQGE